MRAWKDRSFPLRGRLHGRTFKALVGVAVLTSGIALWQFLTLDGGDDAFPELDTDALATADRVTAGAAGQDPTTDETANPSDETASAVADDPADTDPDAPATENAPAHTTAQPGPRCAASLSLESQWGNTITAVVTVVNSGEVAFDGWEVLIAIEDVEVTSVWGMEDAGDGRYRNGWINGALEPGDAAEAGFTAQRKGNPELPETLSCTARS